jgi:hypothetical protein
MGVKTATSGQGKVRGRARLWAKGRGKVNQGKPQIGTYQGEKLPESGTRDTSLP